MAPTTGQWHNYSSSVQISPHTVEILPRRPSSEQSQSIPIHPAAAVVSPCCPALCLPRHTHTHSYHCLAALCLGTTQMSRYQKQHSPTHTHEETERFTQTTTPLHGSSSIFSINFHEAKPLQPIMSHQLNVQLLHHV